MPRGINPPVAAILEKPEYPYYPSGFQAKFSYYDSEFNPVFADAPVTLDAPGG